MKLNAVTLRPGATPPSRLHGRVLLASAVAELAAIDHAELGRVYLVHAEGQRPRYYLPAAVESCELLTEAETAPPERRCDVCGETLDAAARGETCSKSCARRLGLRRTGR